MLSPIIQIVNAFAYLVALAIPLLIGIAIIVFFYGLIQYILHPDKAHRQTMYAGLIALFVMVSVWGIVRFAQNALGVSGNANSPQNAPYIPTTGGSNTTNVSYPQNAL